MTHDQGQEADDGADAANDAVHQQRLQQGRAVFHQRTHPALEGFNPAAQDARDPGPTQAWEIWNTRNMTTAKMGMPSQRLVRMLSILSWEFFWRVRTLRVSTSLTMR